MKKVISLLLLLSFLVTAVACAKPVEGNEAIDIGSDITPGATLAPGQTPPPGFTVAPDGTVVPDTTLAPGETPDPNATLAPGVTPDPNATPAPGQTPGASTSPGASASPAPSSGAAPKNYSEAKKINSDVVGWIDIPGTNIDYPILYKYDKATNEFFYNNHDVYKKSTGNPGTGSIYSYYNDVTRNIIISGHNMRESGSMFHDLHKIQNNKSSLTTRSNRIFEVKLQGFKAWNADAQSKWEVFALYETKDSEPSSTLKENIHPLSNKSKADVEAWIAKQKSRSEVKLDVSVTADDILMTLVTCGDNYDYSDAQSRLYIFLKAVS